MNQFPEVFDVRMEEHILFHDGDMSADFLHNSFSGCTPFNVGIQELLRLIGGKQLDGQDILQLFCRRCIP